MTNNSPLDEHIKEKLGNYSPDVPPHIWENIMANKERRKPVGFWLFFMNRNLLLLLLGITLASTFILYKTVFSPEKNKVLATETPVTQLIKDKEKVSENTSGVSSKNNSPLPEKNKVLATETPVTQLIKDKEKVSENTSGVSNKKNSPLNENNLSKENSIIKNTIVTAENNVPNENSLIKNTIITTPDKDISLTGKNRSKTGNKNKFSLNTSENDNNDIREPITEDNIKKNLLNKRSKSKKGLAVLSINNTEASSDEITEANSKNYLLSGVLLNPELLSSKNILTPSIKKINNPHIDVPCPKAEKNAAGNKRYVEFYAGPDYAFRSFTDTTNSIYLQKRKESTTFTSAFSAGLRYTKVFSNGISIRTGVNYSQINEKFKFSEGNIIQKVYIVNTNGDTTGVYTAIGTRYKTTYNKYRTFDIPLTMGYELGNGRLHANFNAGVILNLYSWQQGDVLDTSYKPVNITTGRTSSAYQFRTNIGIGFLGAISVYYKLTDKWHIFAEPYFRYNLSPASKSELTFKQKYNTAGIRVGVRLDF